jgi:NitT/TauT family transport system permease protein
MMDADLASVRLDLARQARKPSSRLRKTLLALMAPLAFFLLGLGIWYAVTYLVLSPERRFLLPPPHSVVTVAFFQGYNLHTLLSALGITTEIAMISLGLSILFAVVLAIMMAEIKFVERGFYPYLIISQAIPVLALVPLVGFWLGFGYPARIVICVLISFFPICVNTIHGLQTYPSSYEELFSLYDTSRFTRLTKLKLPMALPAMFAGFRIAAGLVVVGEVVGGFYFQQGPPDLGGLFDEFTARINGEMLFGAIICASALGVAVFWIVNAIGALTVNRWKE